MSYSKHHTKPSDRRPIFHKPTLLIGLIISGILICMMWINVNLTAAEAASAQGRAVLTALDQAITQCTAATEAMSQVVQANDGAVKTFEQMAASISDTGAPINSIQLAPDGVVTYIYPEQGNEAGKIDLFKEPDRKAEAILARDSGETIVAGPFQLKQGGFGMAIRKPVYLGAFNPEDASNFWGFAIVIAHVDDILKTANIASLSELGYQYQLTASVDGQDIYVAGKSDTAGMKNVTQEIYGKNWTLWISPHIWPQTMFLTIAGSSMLVILSLLFAALFQQTRALDRQRVTDGLTGLLNRRGFDLAMEQAEKAAGAGQFVLIAIDLNNFKSFNDMYGHDNGDVLLRSFAKELTELVGKTGEAARNGGDEFQILLKNPKEGWKKAYGDFFNRLHHFVYYGKRYEYKISAGYVIYPDQSDSMRGLYQKADTALYHAKSDADTRFCRYEPTMSREPREQLGFNFKNLAAGAPAAILIYHADKTEQILYANEQCVSLFGCESLGDFMVHTRGSFRTLVHPDDAAWAEDVIDKQQSDPEQHHVDYLIYRIVCKDGTVKSVIDIGRRFRHEYYGDVYVVFFMDEQFKDKFAICQGDGSSGSVSQGDGSSGSNPDQI